MALLITLIVVLDPGEKPEVPEDAAVSPDGRFVALPVEHGGDRKLVLVDATGAQPARPLTEEEGDDGEPLWSPDSRRVLFLRIRPDDGAPELRVATVGQPGSRLIARAPSVDATWSPDGRWLAVVLPEPDPGLARRGGALTVFAATGGHRRVLAPNRPASAPRWSPDGDRILFWSGHRGPDQVGDQPGDLYAVSWRGGAARRLTTSGHVEPGSHSWTATGASITYTRDAGVGFLTEAIVRQALATGAREELLPPNRLASWNVAPAPAPSEPLVAVEGDGLYVVGGSAAQAPRLHGKAVGGSLYWSPDGTLVAHDTTHGLLEPIDADVLVVDPRRRRVVNVTRTPSHDETLVGWIAGRRLAVLRDDGTLWSISANGRSHRRLETRVDSEARTGA